MVWEMQSDRRELSIKQMQSDRRELSIKQMRSLNLGVKS